MKIRMKSEFCHGIQLVVEIKDMIYIKLKQILLIHACKN